MKLGLRELFLVLLMMQNAFYTLLRRYASGMLKEQWLPSACLLVAEMMKLVFSCVSTIRDKSPTDAKGEGLAKIVWVCRNSFVMFVPAFIYFIMNLLSFVALQRVTGTMFTVVGQLKIVSTGVFGVLILGRHYTPRKWRAMVLVGIGAALVSNIDRKDMHRLTGDAEDADENEGFTSMLIGLGAVLLEVTLSGFASVYFERVLKSKQENLSVWDRNIQLAMYSLLLYTPLAVYRAPGGHVFIHWTNTALVISMLGAAGGLLVSLAVKYSDSVMKSLSVSAAIILCASFEYLFMDAPLSVVNAMGAVCVILAIFNYLDEGNNPQFDDASAKNTPKV
mmetsp:Transcript_456/g.494  ORF Transcript_456/g.494 Transcript_456/m.494 type:complete len:335 (+) Transcript_456:466-1470(+)|eukprot:CAMPEP_0197850050 /NCGR_PEP_ID=MMETSP1438-20131217/14093_1 /TAXON_ID=1461541 /ORGANISM="Pterosperma sp., Strain CCMP1384" /LENGTH=334 /DNA_ID=CAMNT_0043463001 /DNA_START=460 /DNA_END=1464 /DNA_ORIENTATION=-